MKKESGLLKILIATMIALVMFFAGVVFVLQKEDDLTYAIEAENYSSVEFIKTFSGASVSYDGGSEVAWAGDIVVSGSTTVVATVRGNGDLFENLNVECPNTATQMLVSLETQSYTISSLVSNKFYTLHYDSGTSTFIVSEIATYGVVYNLNGGTASVMPTDENQYANGDSFEFASTNGITKSGYVIVGWALTNNATEGLSTYTIDSDDATSGIITFYAVWNHACGGKTFANPLSSFTSNYLSSGSYYLTADITYSGAYDIIIQNETEVSICLNGHVLNLNGKKIQNGGNLYICDCKNNSSSGIVTYFDVDANGNWTKHTTSGTTDHFCYGGYITNGECAIYSDYGSEKLEVDGVNFVANGNSSSFAGAIEMESQSAELVISNSNFYGNKSLNESLTGAVHSVCETTITSSNFENNVGGSYGGAVYCLGNLVIDDCVFDNNSTSGDGGAIYAKNGLSVSDSIFTNNSATSGGGAIFSSYYYSMMSSETTIDSCEFENNSATNGGAIYIANCANIYDSTFENNSATECGGAIYLESNNLIEGCEISSNSAGNGGGIYSYCSSTAIVGTTIQNNTATENGAGVYVKYSGGCLVEGTLITMADGTTKSIEDVEVGDIVKSFNHETGNYENKPIYFVFESTGASSYFVLHFESGTTLAICDLHDLYEQSTNKYVRITSTNYKTYIGKYFYNATNSSWDKLVSVTKSTDKKHYYSIYAAKTYNVIANGMLSVPDDVDLMFEIYEFNSDLTVNQEALQADVAEYGWFEFEDCDIIKTYEEYDMYNIKYVNILVGKGLLDINNLQSIYDEICGNNTSNEQHSNMFAGPLMATGLLGSSTNTYANYEDLDTDTYCNYVVLGTDTVITENTVEGEENNLYLENNTYVYVEENATGIEVGISVEAGYELGIFAKEVYTNIESQGSDVVVKFTSDNSGYSIKKVETQEESGLFNYSLYVISGEPSMTNDYEVEVVDGLEDETYQWFKGTDELEGETSSKLGYDADGEPTGLVLEDEDYHCVVYSNGDALQTSENIHPKVISFAGGDGATGTAPSTQYQLEGRIITLPANTFTKTGFVFVGWGDGTNVYTTEYTVGSNDVTLTAEWRVVVSISTNAQTFTYGDNNIEYSVQGTSLTGFDVKYWVNNAWVSTAPTNAGSYNVKVTRARDSYYDEVSEEIANGLVIEKYDIAITFCANDFTYNGTNQINSVTATYKNINNSDVYLQADYCVINNSRFPIDFINAGEYTVYFDFVTAEEKQNYRYIIGYANYTIKKAKVTKPIENTTAFTYTGVAQTYTLATSDLYTISNNSRTVVGTQTVIVSLNDKYNYEWDELASSTEDLEFAFEIKKAKNLITNLRLSKEIIYCGDKIIPSATSQFGDITYKYKLAESDTWIILTATNYPKAVGVYMLKAQVDETTNYDGATTDLPFNILAKEIEKQDSSSEQVKNNGSKTELIEGSLDVGLVIVIKKDENKKNDKTIKENVKNAVTGKSEIVAKFDIHLEDKNGTKVENIAGNRYRVTLVMSEQILGKTGYAVVYIDNNNNVTKINSTMVNKETIVFETDHFSTWAIVADENSSSWVFCLFGAISILAIALVLFLLLKRKLTFVVDGKVVAEIKLKPYAKIEMIGDLEAYEWFLDETFTISFTKTKMGLKSIKLFGKIKKLENPKTTRSRKVSKATKE